MSLQDHDLSPDPEEAASQAFARSGAHVFRGKKLLPYSFRRQAARSRIGLSMKTAGDSAFLIFLCLTPDEDVASLYTPDAILEWRMKAEDWAEKNKISEAQAKEVNTIAAAILADVHASEFRVQQEGGRGGDARPKRQGRPAKRNTSRTSQRSSTAR